MFSFLLIQQSCLSILPLGLKASQEQKPHMVGELPPGNMASEMLFLPLFLGKERFSQQSSPVLWAGFEGPRSNPHQGSSCWAQRSGSQGQSLPWVMWGEALNSSHSPDHNCVWLNSCLWGWTQWDHLPWSGQHCSTLWTVTEAHNCAMKIIQAAVSPVLQGTTEISYVQVGSPLVLFNATLPRKHTLF